MEKRYVIAKDSIFADCLVTPGAYEGVLERLTHFTMPFFTHLSTCPQQEKALAYFKGLRTAPWY